MLIGFEILISEESPYLSHYTCKILNPKDFYLKSYKGKRLRKRMDGYYGGYRTVATFSLGTFTSKSAVKFHRHNEKIRGFHLVTKNSTLMEESICDRNIHF